MTLCEPTVQHDHTAHWSLLWSATLHRLLPSSGRIRFTQSLLRSSGFTFGSIHFDTLHDTTTQSQVVVNTLWCRITSQHATAHGPDAAMRCDATSQQQQAERVYYDDVLSEGSYEAMFCVKCDFVYIEECKRSSCTRQQTKYETATNEWRMESHTFVIYFHFFFAFYNNNNHCGDEDADDDDGVSSFALFSLDIARFGSAQLKQTRLSAWWNRQQCDDSQSVSETLNNRLEHVKKSFFLHFFLSFNFFCLRFSSLPL